jgi:hypothetical protein
VLVAGHRMVVDGLEPDSESGAARDQPIGLAVVGKSLAVPVTDRLLDFRAGEAWSL